MKKALSVLLVAAALFGFYGSAVTVNDLLACKDYWEEAGEKSTADMNRLEDGLNQLKDNEQAYLDGLQQVADGEIALADGEAQYAQGLADYAAAPAKLADARKQLADGKDQLDEGKAQLDGLTTLINYLSDVQNTYDKWKPKYQNAANDRQTTADTINTYKAAIKAYENFISGESDEETATLKATFDAYVDMLAANDVTNAGKKNDATEGFIMYINLAAGIYNNCNLIKNTMSSAVTGMKTLRGGLLQCQNEDETWDLDKLATFATNYEEKLAGFLTEDQIGYLKNKVTYGDAAASTATALLSGLSSNITTYEGYLTSLSAADPALTAMATYVGNYGKATGNADVPYDSDKIRELAGADGGQGYMAAVCQGVAENVLGNKTLKDAVKKNLGSDGINLLTALAKTEMLWPYVEDTYDSGVEFSKFIYEMETYPGILTQLKKAKELLINARAEGQKTYNQGKAKYNDGMAQYQQGLADYAAAPGKLADAEQQLADGRKQLEDGKAQLAQYEDGEQQVRDGLASLFNTEADLDLVSIADRLNGDGDFDNGDNHLELDEGLAAVEVGRGYQADDGVLITKEIMGRAVATGGLIAAAALAVIAAILSFLKKNKAAGVFAILAAAAGAFGALYGPAQGVYFSEIAGSTIGATTWVAAGVLGGVALVHAIVHFAAPKTVA